MLRSRFASSRVAGVVSGLLVFFAAGAARAQPQATYTLPDPEKNFTVMGDAVAPLVVRVKNTLVAATVNQIELTAPAGQNFADLQAFVTVTGWTASLPTTADVVRFTATGLPLAVNATVDFPLFLTGPSGAAIPSASNDATDKLASVRLNATPLACGTPCQTWKRHGLTLTLVATPESVRVRETIRLEYRIENRTNQSVQNAHSIPAAPTTTVLNAVTGPADPTPASTDIGTSSAGTLTYDATAILNNTTFQFRASAANGNGQTTSPPRLSNRVAVGDLTAVLFVEPSSATGGQAFDVVMRVQNNGQTNTSNPLLFGASAIGNVRPAADPTFTGTATSSTKVTNQAPDLIPSLAYRATAEFRWSYSATAAGVATYSFSGQALGNGTQSPVVASNVGTLIPATLTVSPKSIARGSVGPLIFTASNNTGNTYPNKLVLQFPPAFNDGMNTAITSAPAPAGYTSAIVNGAAGAMVTYTPTGADFPSGTSLVFPITFSATGVPAIPSGNGDQAYVVKLGFRNATDTANLFLLSTDLLVTAQRIALTATPVAVNADGNSTIVLTATVTNVGDGSPVAGVRVRFTKTAGSLSSETVTTLANGQASTVITAPASTVTIFSLVTATYVNASDDTLISFIGTIGANVLYVGGTLFPRQVAPGSTVGFAFNVQNVGTADAVLDAGTTTFQFAQAAPACTFQSTIAAAITIPPGEVRQLAFVPATVNACFAFQSGLYATFTYNPTRAVNDPLQISATPTFASVTGLEAEPYGDGAIVRWATDLEFANDGFRVLRAKGAGEPDVLDAWIPASGESFSDYQWIDAPLDPGVYSYWIEDVALDGLATRHGPVVLALGVEPLASAPPALLGGGRVFEPGDVSVWSDPSDLGDVRVLAQDEDGITYEIVPPPYDVTQVPSPVALLDLLRIPRYGVLEEMGRPQLPVRQFLVPVPDHRLGRLEILSIDDRTVAGVRPALYAGQSSGNPFEGLETSFGDGPAFTGALGQARHSSAPSGAATFPQGPVALVDRGRMGARSIASLVLTPLRWSEGDALLHVADRIVVRVHFRPADPVVARAPLAAQLVQERILSGPSLAVSASREGLVRVPRSAVLAAGVGALEDVAVHRRGVVVPSRVEGDELLFVVPPFRSFWSSREAWWIAPRAGAPVVIPQTGALVAPGIDADLTVRTARFEKEKIYAILNGAGVGPDRWYWATVSAGGALADAQVTFELPRVAAGTPAEMTVTLQGTVQDPGSVDEHVVRLLVNGQELDTVTLSDFERRAFTLAIPGGLLLEGTNTLALSAISTRASQVGLDAIEVRWTAPAEAQDAAELRVVAAADGTLTATGFADAPLFAIDETDPAAPALLALSTAPANGAWSASVTAPAGTAVRFVTATAPSPATWTAHAALASTVLTPPNGADYVVISASDLVASAEGFATWRRSASGGGMRAVTFDVADLYDAFSFGDVDPDAVQRFLRHAQENWPRRSPRYVLLVGSSTYDPRDHLGYGVSGGLLLSGRVSTEVLNAASDNVSAATGDGDVLPDMAIGRIPARDAATVLSVLAKSKAYESAPRDGWDRRQVLLSDDDLPDFDATADESSLLLPRGITARRISASASGASASRDALLGGIGEGAAVVSYVGHGGVQTWGGESYLKSLDAPSLANDRLPVVVAVNCLNGFFDHPAVDSLSEALLQAGGQGAAAVWTSSAITRNGGHRELALAFQQAFWREPDLRLGDAVNHALANVAWRGDAEELIGSFVLLGDPALRPNVNAPPVAKARIVSIDGGRARLSGLESSDADGDALAWRWEVISTPAGAVATLDGASGPEPTLVASAAGRYRLRLRVADASLAGPPADVVVDLTAADGERGATSCSVALPSRTGTGTGTPWLAVVTAMLAAMLAAGVVVRRRRG